MERKWLIKKLKENNPELTNLFVGRAFHYKEGEEEDGILEPDEGWKEVGEIIGQSNILQRLYFAASH